MRQPSWAMPAVAAHEACVIKKMCTAANRLKTEPGGRMPAAAAHEERVAGEDRVRGPLLAAEEADVAVGVPAPRRSCLPLFACCLINMLYIICVPSHTPS